MRILLIQPDSAKRMVGFTSLVRPEPLALEIIAATVPDHEVKILDMRVDPTLEETLRSFSPHLVGITGYTTDVPRMQELVRLVKAHDPQIVVVLGGYHASLVPEDFNLPWVDFIVVGEGEVTFQELVHKLDQGSDCTGVEGIIYRSDGQQVRNALRPMVKHMDELPLPARHLTDHYREQYHFHFWDNPYLVETARGCPFKCNFCSVWKFHRAKCRFRGPAKVLEDIKTVASDVVCFVDDNFFQNVRRAEHIYERIRDAGIKAHYWMQVRSDSIVKHPELIRKWASLGMASALIGFEKFRDEDLNGINKSNSIQNNERAMEIMQQYEVDIWGAFIVDPGWIRADFDAMIEYVQRWKISFPQFTVLTPLPGTAFFQEKFDELITHNYEVFDLLHTVLPTKLPLEEFYANMARLYMNTTLGVSELKKRIRSGLIPRSSIERVRALLHDVTSTEAYLRSLAPSEGGSLIGSPS